MNDIFNTTAYDQTIAAGIFGMILLIYLVFLLLSIGFRIISRWIFFKKCGEEGWKSLIPIYTDITLIKISGLNILWIFLIYLSSVLSISSFIVSSFNNMETINIPVFVSYIITLLYYPSYIVGIFAKYNLSYNLSKKFNQGVGYAFLILFFQPIMFLVLGLSKTFEYDKDVVVSPNGVLGARTESNSVFCKECGNKLNKNDIYCQNCGTKVR